MTRAELTASFENYLKVIWSSREWADQSLTTNDLANRMGFAPSTVSEAVKKLAERGLVTHRPYGSIDLTDTGTIAALHMVRRHRLIETFLVDYLGYSWDEVHAEAELLEHAISETFVDRLAAKLGHPTRDPHGDPIPDRDGHIQHVTAVQLNRAPLNKTLTVTRVSDQVTEVLKYLRDRSLDLDTSVTVLDRNDGAGVMTIDVRGNTSELSMIAANAVWVTT